LSFYLGHLLNEMQTMNNGSWVKVTSEQEQWNRVIFDRILRFFDLRLDLEQRK